MSDTITTEERPAPKLHELATMQKLTAWITECGHLHPTTPITPVRVHIGEQSWIGVRYITRHHYEAGMDACRWGKQKPGDPYDDEKVYCLGERPKVNQKPSPRPGHVCYRSKEGVDWFLASYAGLEHITPRVMPYHPFGPNFMVCPWNFTGCAIDDGYWKKPKRPWLPRVHDPYLRYPISFTDL